MYDRTERYNMYEMIVQAQNVAVTTMRINTSYEEIYIINNKYILIYKIIGLYILLYSDIYFSLLNNIFD